MSWSYGRKVVDHVSIGTALNKISRSVDTSADSAMTADLGTLIDMKDGTRRLQDGLAVLRLGQLAAAVGGGPCIHGANLSAP